MNARARLAVWLTVIRVRASPKKIELLLDAADAALEADDRNVLYTTLQDAYAMMRSLPEPSGKLEAARRVLWTRLGRHLHTVRSALVVRLI